MTAGELRQLASGDALGGITGGTATGEVITQDQLGTNYNNLSPTGSPVFGNTSLGAGKTLTLPPSCLRLSDATSSGHYLAVTCSDGVLTSDRVLAIIVSNATRTLQISGDATLSGTNTGDQTTVSGNAGTATALQTSRTIGGSSFDGTANVTSFPEPGSIGGTTPADGRFTKMGIGVTPSGAASALLCVGGNPTTFTSANYVGVVDSTNGGALVLSKDGSNYATLQYSNASGSFVFQTVEAATSYTNSMAIKSGCILLGGTTVPSLSLIHI
jgi:hypothetical protein